MVIKRRREEESLNQVKTTSFGVCTRAKSLALKRSMLSNTTSPITTIDEVSDACYLHLRSRRLERYPSVLLKKPIKKKLAHEKNDFHLDEKENEGLINFGEKRKDEGRIALGENERENGMKEKQEKVSKRDETNKNEEKDGFKDLGENDLAFNKRERETKSPLMPSVQDLEEFFSAAEKDCTEIFTNKYNFDWVEEKPFEGRFQWEKIKP